MIPPPYDSTSTPMYTTPRGTCPECGSGGVTHILLGMPDPGIVSTLPTWVTIGGCCIGPDIADRQCTDCGHEWSSVDAADDAEDGPDQPTRLHFGTDLWDEIAPVSRRAGPRRAAIAFLGDAAPDLLGKFGSRDRLVVNAGQRALESGATSPAALEALFKRGVQLGSYDRLHAKVIVTRDWAVIGSSNASTASNRSEEAVVITRDQALVADARIMIDGLWEQSIDIDRPFIAHAKQLAKNATRTNFGVPGIVGIEQFPPRPIRAMYFAECEPAEVPDEVDEAMRAARAEARSEVRPGLTLESWWDRNRSTARRDDVIIRFTSEDDDYYVNQPSRIVVKKKVPGVGHGWVYTLQSLRDRNGLWLSEIADVLDSAGVDTQNLDGAVVDDPTSIDRVLGLWD